MEFTAEQRAKIKELIAACKLSAMTSHRPFCTIRQISNERKCNCHVGAAMDAVTGTGKLFTF